MEDLVEAINHALNCGQNKLQWYKTTGDSRYMEQCKEWNEIACIYMNQLIMEQKYESCEN